MARHAILLALLPLLTACNMVVSDKPMFDAADRGGPAPRDGIWLSEDKECRFDATLPESGWPECAMWVVVRNSGTELLVSDGKGQSQRIGAVFAAGNPAIVQGQWTDDAKDPTTTHFGFYGLEPGQKRDDGRFTNAGAWPVQCGVQQGSDIKPFPGIGPDCRPESKDAIRAAAIASRQSEDVSDWRWLRAESE